MKNYQPNYLSMLLLMFVCIASCSNETTSGPGFEIGGTPAESVYQIPSDRKVRLPGTGFQTGDIVRLTDTGISHNTYRVEAAVEDDGAVITLPGNFVDGRYELFIVRGTRQFRYGLAVFRADSDRPGELDRPDYDRLTADRHPRLLMDDEAFGSLMKQVRAGNNQQNQPENNLFAQRIVRIKKKSRFKRSRIRSGQMVLYPFLTQQSANRQKQKNPPCPDSVLIVVANHKQHPYKQDISHMGNIFNQFPFNRYFQHIFRKSIINSAHKRQPQNQKSRRYKKRRHKYLFHQKSPSVH